MEAYVDSLWSHHHVAKLQFLHICGHLDQKTQKNLKSTIKSKVFLVLFFFLFFKEKLVNYFSY